MCKVPIQVLKLAFLVTDRPSRMTNAALIITHSRLLSKARYAQKN